jgi:CheY-like chemotaxis protein
MKRILSPDITTWRVLAIDDKDDNLEIIRAILTHAGVLQVTVASSGSEGLDAVPIDKPNLILLDISMPETTGWDVFDAVRNNTESAHIPIIAVTAHAMESEKRQILDRGFDGYIPKPYNIHSLVEAIRTQLSDVPNT